MKNTDARFTERMEKLIHNSREFTRKKDYSTGLGVHEYFYFAENMSGKDGLWNALDAAYDIGYRRGYNKAKKDLAGR